MVSLTTFVAIAPPSLVFLILSAILFLRWRNKRDIQTLYFSFAFLFMGLCFGMWVLRTIFYPPKVDLSEVDILIRLGYIFGILGTSFIGLTAIMLIKPQLIKKRMKLIFFFAPAISLGIVMTFIADPIPALITGVVDFVWGPPVAILLFAVGLYYFIFPNYLFIWWLWYNRDHHLYNKILIIEIGLIIFCAGTIIEATKVGMESFGIIVRWMTAAGGLIMAYRYIKK